MKCQTVMDVETANNDNDNDDDDE